MPRSSDHASPSLLWMIRDWKDRVVQNHWLQLQQIVSIECGVLGNVDVATASVDFNRRP